jgi:hypothetical protein
MKKKRRIMDAQITKKQRDSGKLIAENRLLKIAEN